MMCLYPQGDNIIFIVVAPEKYGKNVRIFLCDICYILFHDRVSRIGLNLGSAYEYLQAPPEIDVSIAPVHVCLTSVDARPCCDVMMLPMMLLAPMAQNLQRVCYCHSVDDLCEFATSFHTLLPLCPYVVRYPHWSTLLGSRNGPLVPYPCVSAS